jgi:hypothetical protein
MPHTNIEHSAVRQGFLTGTNQGVNHIIDINKLACDITVLEVGQLLSYKQLLCKD